VNDYWIYIQQQEWFTGLNLDNGYDETLNSITADDVKQLANEMLNQRNLIQVVMSSPIQKK
jgi:predicted Zn-dependent peptidase